jgi:hypothetical protein
MKLSWESRLGIVLIFISALIYYIKFLLIGNPENIFDSVFNSLGFLPLNALLVTLILERLLANRSKEARLEKLNIVIGTFFSEMGTWLLTYLSDNDPKLHNLRGDLVNIDRWSDDEFGTVRDKLKSHTYSIQIGTIDIKALRNYLASKRDFSLRLLENPVLLEKESFTNLLRAVFHLTEELEQRGDFSSLPETDLQHLAVDIGRAYYLLVMEWIAYMIYLNKNYPYLFSLAMRTNPFDKSASVTVK